MIVASIRATTPQDMIMDKTRLATLGCSILEAYASGDTPTLERDWAALMAGTARDVFLFTYSMAALAQEATAVLPPLIEVTTPMVADGYARPRIDLPDTPRARRVYAALRRSAGKGDPQAAIRLWVAFAQAPGGDAEMPTVASYALREAYVQAVARMRVVAS